MLYFVIEISYETGSYKVLKVHLRGYYAMINNFMG